MIGTPDRYKYFEFSSYLFINPLGALVAYPKVKPNYEGLVTIFHYHVSNIIFYFVVASK